MESVKNIFTNWKKGLTWPKVLLGMVVIAVLAAAIIVAINPRKQFAKMRNSQRRGDVSLILNAVYQYTVDNEGRLPAELDAQPQEICKEKASCQGLADLGKIVLKKKNSAYLSSMPTDPNGGSENGTGYEVKNTNGRITVSAPHAEQGAMISATR